MAANPTVPPQHSRRVEAWVHSVLNPIIDGLSREQLLLKSGNLSWRAYSRRFEYVRPVIEYVDPSQQPNLEDFLNDPENLGFEDRFRRHDDLQRELELETNGFFDGLMNSAPFSEQVGTALRQYATDPHSSSYSTTMTDESVARFVGEYLINSIENLEQHYGLHEFWSRNRQEFRRLAEGAELGEKRGSFDRARRKLLEESGSLLGQLKGHRHYLCAKFDVPAAPFPNVRSA